ncbi:MAG: hypothetical protein Q7V10_01710 [Methanobacteriaceae archaeon]|jgi:hypothetical protein|nr:hypothetical protein [Methanobacteriaceae archaeon]MDO9628187.1 hypothetical protein [Methanobacteriaceae archaeon]
MDFKLIETILAIIIMIFLGYGMRRSGLLKYGDAKFLIPSLMHILLICILIGIFSGLIAYLWGKMKGYSKPAGV